MEHPPNSRSWLSYIARSIRCIEFSSASPEETRSAWHSRPGCASGRAGPTQLALSFYELRPRAPHDAAQSPRSEHGVGSVRRREARGIAVPAVRPA